MTRAIPAVAAGQPFATATQHEVPWSIRRRAGSAAAVPNDELLLVGPVGRPRRLPPARPTIASCVGVGGGWSLRRADRRPSASACHARPTVPPSAKPSWTVRLPACPFTGRLARRCVIGRVGLFMLASTMSRYSAAVCIGS